MNNPGTPNTESHEAARSLGSSTHTSDNLTDSMLDYQKAIDDISTTYWTNTSSIQSDDKDDSTLSDIENNSVDTPTNEDDSTLNSSIGQQPGTFKHPALDNDMEPSSKNLPPIKRHLGC